MAVIRHPPREASLLDMHYWLNPILWCFNLVGLALCIALPIAFH